MVHPWGFVKSQWTPMVQQWGFVKSLWDPNGSRAPLEFCEVAVGPQWFTVRVL